MNRRLPVTLVGGFLGVGKTSLLHYFISEHRGGHLALLVDSPGVVNHDAKALRGLCGAMRREHDIVLEIPSGDDEAAQIDWIAERLREWSLEGSYEQVLIEVGGTVNAARLGRHFGVLPEHAKAFSPWAELRQIICVVDALDFFRAAGASELGALADFQRAQIASANKIVLNKCDLIDDIQRSQCSNWLRALNPGAFMIETAYGEMAEKAWSLTHPLPESCFAADSSAHLGASGEAAKKMEPGSLALGSVLYRAYRPFHPARFWEWFNAEHAGLLRVKGIVWLATRSLLVGGISRTRWQNSCGGAGVWWAALPREDWPSETEALRRMQETWREPYGDRRQELVLVGEAAPLAAVARGLDASLLREEEFALPWRDWSALPDPFPAWDFGGEE
ncbi:MAG TPA: GTP-binding protein [Candidatus Methylacidiphilales bacterium]|nr:GTP-binding protein [Candidatus Methylacidiphilales bacterium]